MAMVGTAHIRRHPRQTQQHVLSAIAPGDRRETIMGREGGASGLLEVVPRPPMSAFFLVGGATIPAGSEILGDPQSVVNGGMRIARRNRVTNPEELELALLIPDDRLGLPGQKLVV